MANSRQTKHDNASLTSPAVGKTRALLRATSRERRLLQGAQINNTFQMLRSLPVTKGTYLIECGKRMSR